MDQATLSKLLDHAKTTARAAGKAILAIPVAPADATAKADGSPLTRADLASHAIIERGLRKLTPAFPIVSEEGDLETAARTPAETFWLVDPLDGTKEFLKGLGEYTVNIALVERGFPILGVVYVPPADVMYWAARGMGAWKSEAAGPPQAVRPSCARMPRTAVVSRSHLDRETEAFLARLKVTQVIQRGSSVKMCAVAEGAADIYPRFGPTNLWDTAAGTAIAREAGCRVADLAGKDLSYALSGGLKHAGFIVCPPGLGIV